MRPQVRPQRPAPDRMERRRLFRRPVPIAPVREQLAAVIDALDWASAPKTDEHVDALDRQLGNELRGYAPAGRVRALFSRERIEANRQRREVAALRAVLEILGHPAERATKAEMATFARQRLAASRGRST